LPNSFVWGIRLTVLLKFNMTESAAHRHTHAQRERERESERERERANTHQQEIACYRSFDMGLSSAGDHKLGILNDQGIIFLCVMKI
jgi:hypothetical protein